MSSEATSVIFLEFYELEKYSAFTHYVGSTVVNERPFIANPPNPGSGLNCCVELVRTFRTSVEDRRSFVCTPQLDILELELWVVALRTLLIDELL